MTDIPSFESFYATEAKLAWLNHPNIINVFSWKMLPRQAAYMLLMEMCEYGDLGKLLSVNNPQMSVDNARCIVRQIAGAVGSLHRVGVAHRDLKLENILVTGYISNNHPHYNIKVADFGLSSVNVSLCDTR